MSIFFDRLRKDPFAQEIEEKNSPFCERRSEGAPYLFYRGAEHYDLMGHYVKYYAGGVLLALKDKHKDHPNEDSFIFFNNNGEKVLEISNIIHAPAFSFLPNKEPVKNIEIIVRSSFIEVKETIIETNETEHYFISIKQGNKLTDVFEEKKENPFTI